MSPQERLLKAKIAARRSLAFIGHGLGYGGDTVRKPTTIDFGCVCDVESACACDVGSPSQWFAFPPVDADADADAAPRRESRSSDSKRWFIAGGRVSVRNAHAEDANATTVIRLRSARDDEADIWVDVEDFVAVDAPDARVRFVVVVEALRRYKSEVIDRDDCHPALMTLFMLPRRNAQFLPTRVRKDEVRVVWVEKFHAQTMPKPRVENMSLSMFAQHAQRQRMLMPDLFPEGSVVVCAAAGRAYLALRAAKRWPTKLVVVVDNDGEAIQAAAYAFAAAETSNMIILRCDAREVPWRLIPKGAVFSALFDPPCEAFSTLHGYCRNFDDVETQSRMDEAEGMISWSNENDGAESDADVHGSRIKQIFLRWVYSRIGLDRKRKQSPAGDAFAPAREALTPSNFQRGARVLVAGSFNDDLDGYNWYAEVVDDATPDGSLRVRWLQKKYKDGDRDSGDFRFEYATQRVDTIPVHRVLELIPTQT